MANGDTTTHHQTLARRHLELVSSPESRAEPIGGCIAEVGAKDGGRKRPHLSRLTLVMMDGRRTAVAPLAAGLCRGPFWHLQGADDEAG
jgi:hypothetical protein